MQNARLGLERNHLLTFIRLGLGVEVRVGPELGVGDL